MQNYEGWAGSSVWLEHTADKEVVKAFITASMDTVRSGVQISFGPPTIRIPDAFHHPVYRQSFSTALPCRRLSVFLAAFESLFT